VLTNHDVLLELILLFLKFWMDLFDLSVYNACEMEMEEACH